MALSFIRFSQRFTRGGSKSYSNWPSLMVVGLVSAYEIGRDRNDLTVFSEATATATTTATTATITKRTTGEAKEGKSQDSNIIKKAVSSNVCIDVPDNRLKNSNENGTTSNLHEGQMRKDPQLQGKAETVTAGMKSYETGEFHGLFPKRQLWQPTAEYPLWDANWDGKQLPSTGDKEKDRQHMRQLRKTGITRHIILVRHGQYDETQKEDKKRILTPIGRQQADVTGRRLAEMVRGAEDRFGPCNIKILRVSNLARAKETLDIISRHLPGVTQAEPDPRLNEGRPCHNIPGGRASTNVIKATDDSHGRIEDGFRSYFFRADAPREGDKQKETAVDSSNEAKHEFEIIVCHANVIRYFLCRALQLPPEVWLRLCTFNCSLTYLTIRPTGSVSCRMLGDIGHLPYNLTTFSQHHGFNW